jgi:hypothetical protein
MVNNNGEMKNSFLWDESNAVESGHVRAGQDKTGQDRTGQNACYHLPRSNGVVYYEYAKGRDGAFLYLGIR